MTFVYNEHFAAQGRSHSEFGENQHDGARFAMLAREAMRIAG
jgi:hypothetical protein